MARRKETYDELAKSRDFMDTPEGRDVYDSQNPVRTQLEPLQTMTSRTVFSVAVAVMVALLVYFLVGLAFAAARRVFGGGNDASVSVGRQGLEQEREWDVSVDGVKPISEAPVGVDIPTLKLEYLEYHPADISRGEAVGHYTDSEGNQYVEADLPTLKARVDAMEFMGEDEREAQRIRDLQAANEYGVLPLNLAPMNIDYTDFLKLYFVDTRPDTASLVRWYYDHDGNTYRDTDVRELWGRVQSGALGSGKVSYLEADGGYSPDSAHARELGTYEGANGSIAGQLVSGTGHAGTDGSDGSGTSGGASGSENGGNGSVGLLRSLFGSVGFAPRLFLISALVGACVGAILWQVLRRNLDAQNADNDVTDINQYENDQHIQTPAEMQRRYDWFPDVGAHSNVSVSGMLSHMMLSRKGLKKVPVTRRADTDIVEEDGTVSYLKGEPLLDDDGEPISDMLPMVDEKFGNELFGVSEVPDDPRVRIFYDATRIPYNPGGRDRNKLKYETVADLINGDWTFPEYEVQRPAGAYIVDTEPVNTMVLAITRAGKGQTYIEPVIDMWTRELNPNNMVINDPKGELLVKFYVKGAVRGFQIVQFNLINSMRTDIYNPLGMAAQAAREGDFTKCALYVENIADVFFPTDGSEDPVWPNAANNAFKRAAYGLIDFFIEEEQELRMRAERSGMDPKVLETQLDMLWGKVTLFNCYQLFVQLTSKKERNPYSVFCQRSEAGDFDQGGLDPKTGEMKKAGCEPLTNAEWHQRKWEAQTDAKLWEDKPEIDLLTLYFNATAVLPKNQMRGLIANANNSLRAMAGAEKMLASVYGIAITAMVRCVVGSAGFFPERPATRQVAA